MNLIADMNDIFMISTAPWHPDYEARSRPVTKLRISSLVDKYLRFIRLTNYSRSLNEKAVS